MPQPYNIQLNRYEKAFLSCSQAPREFLSILSGVSRVSRLSRVHTNMHHQTIWDTSTNIIGPTLFFFIWWVLAEAQERQIKRLYFLARDGQILMSIAKIILKYHPMDIDCRYLYGSRQAWLVPSIKSIGQNELDWIMSDWWYALSINSVCHRLGLLPEEIRRFLEAHDLHKEIYLKILTAQEKYHLKQCLQSKDFIEWFKQRSKVDFDNVLGYFRQEGILDGDDYALVDIGLRGNQQWSLNKILEKVGHLPTKGIHGFYLGLTEALKKYPKDHIYGFLFDISSSANRIFIRNNHLYEAFACSTQGRTIKYNQKDGVYYPVFAEPVNQRVIDWGVQEQQAGILNFCEEFISHCPKTFLTPKNYYPVLEKVLYKFINCPSFEEATTYGKFPMDGEMTESNVREIAPVITRTKFWSACLNLKSFDLFWVQATFVRSNLWFEYQLWKVVLPLLTYGYYLANKAFRLLLSFNRE